MAARTLRRQLEDLTQGILVAKRNESAALPSAEIQRAREKIAQRLTRYDGDEVDLGKPLQSFGSPPVEECRTRLRGYQPKRHPVNYSSQAVRHFVAKIRYAGPSMI